VLIERRVDGFGHLELDVLPGQNLVISTLASRGELDDTQREEYVAIPHTIDTRNNVIVPKRVCPILRP
jgi:hypothetical protein